MKISDLVLINMPPLKKQYGIIIKYDSNRAYPYDVLHFDNTIRYYKRKSLELI